MFGVCITISLVKILGTNLAVCLGCVGCCSDDGRRWWLWVPGLDVLDSGHLAYRYSVGRSWCSSDWRGCRRRQCWGMPESIERNQGARPHVSRHQAPCPLPAQPSFSLGGDSIASPRSMLGLTSLSLPPPPPSRPLVVGKLTQGRGEWWCLDLELDSKDSIACWRAGSPLVTLSPLVVHHATGQQWVQPRSAHRCAQRSTGDHDDRRRPGESPGPVLKHSWVLFEGYRRDPIPCVAAAFIFLFCELVRM